MVSCSYGYPRNRTPTHPSEKSIFLQQLPLDGDGAGVPPGRAYGGLRVRTGSLGPPGGGSQTGSLGISLPPGERRAAPRLRRAGGPVQYHRPALLRLYLYKELAAPVGPGEAFASVRLGVYSAKLAQVGLGGLAGC